MLTQVGHHQRAIMGVVMTTSPLNKCATCPNKDRLRVMHKLQNRIGATLRLQISWKKKSCRIRVRVGVVITTSPFIRFATCPNEDRSRVMHKLQTQIGQALGASDLGKERNCRIINICCEAAPNSVHTGRACRGWAAIWSTPPAVR